MHLSRRGCRIEQDRTYTDASIAGALAGIDMVGLSADFHVCGAKSGLDDIAFLKLKRSKPPMAE